MAASGNTPAGTEDAVPAVLDRAAILAVTDLQQESVFVPEWGGTVIVRGLTGTERDSFERSMLNITPKKGAENDNIDLNWQNFRSKLLARCLVDGSGNRLFTDSDAVALGKKSGVVINRLFEIAQRLSGMGDEDVKEMAADLKVVPSEDSGSD